MDNNIILALAKAYVDEKISEIESLKSFTTISGSIVTINDIEESTSLSVNLTSETVTDFYEEYYEEGYYSDEYEEEPFTVISFSEFMKQKIAEEQAKAEEERIQRLLKSTSNHCRAVLSGLFLYSIMEMNSITITFWI